MGALDIRKQLHQHIDNLPDDIIEQIADFTLFMMARRQVAPNYADWDSDQWENFTLGHFFREEDEVGYSLDDAQEVFHP